LAVPPVGFGLHYYVAGRAAMSAEIHIWAIYGLAAAGIVFLVILAWNICAAPLRIERDNHERTKSELDSLKRQTKIKWEVETATYDVGGQRYHGRWFGKEFLLDKPLENAFSLPNDSRNIVLAIPNHLARAYYETSAGTTLLVFRENSAKADEYSGSGSIDIALDSKGAAKLATKGSGNVRLNITGWLEPGRHP
jgi:hypothetical protein